MEIRKGDEDLLIPKENEVILANFKETFFRENLQPDHSTKVFTDDISINRDDIFDLNELITEKLSKYTNAGLIIQAYVKFNNKKQILFSSWSDFQEYSWRESTSISRIVLTWKFNVIFPGYELPQKHTLTVKLSNSMRPDELFRMMISGDFEEIDDIETNFFPVYAKVNFINRSLGDELLDTVGEWVKGLGESELKKNKFILKMKRHKRLISQLIAGITFASLTSVFLVYFLNSLDKLEFLTVGDINLIQLKMIFLSFSLAICGAVLSYAVGTYIGQSLFSLLKNYGDSYVFSITKGDKKKLVKLKKSSRYDLINITLRSIGAFIMDLIITIIIGIIL